MLSRLQNLVPYAIGMPSGGFAWVCPWETLDILIL
jgi:hypothetical protein